MSWEWFTNLMTIFTNGLTSTAYVNTIVNTTNLYVLIQNGTANLMLSTNGTNMGGTFKMLTGGTTPPLQVLTSNLTTALIVNTNGNFGINTNAPQFNEHINGTIGAHGLSTNGTVVSYIGRLNTDELVETAVVTGGGTSSGQWLGNLATATGITLGIYKYASLVSQAGVSAGTTNTSLLVYPASNFTITGLGISTTTVTLGTGTNITAAIQTNGVDAFTVVLTGNASRTHALVSAKSISVTTNDYVNIRWTADGNVASQAYNGSVSYTIP
jgi:hypothetical protein